MLLGDKKDLVAEVAAMGNGLQAGAPAFNLGAASDPARAVAAGEQPREENAND